ncbi:hypothetical protein SAMD00019534_053330 [Acytostelium subglobosum LB1]|uniref:hypothetical protein n=1 Tax=Acytostelium subglobosum LB1 TaxID=1410327 RepID=UPI00064506B6|nr:hypothetical protein SAMD00019534_053330 [Acytostelium subglobosum LB1]GAM22158.1 hypothetical protein SAMD00019534_053330 [Acytostelium subglobosum LB1]|eukprot:XP_012755258.1 hypothetical protein SAMD00019534_053330 [Acytostelium subglobosum LB1]
MGVVKLLCRCLLIDLEANKSIPSHELRTKVMNTFSEMKVNLADHTDKSLVDCFRSSRVNYENCKSILFNHKKLVTLYSEATGKKYPERTKRVLQLWEQLHALLNLCHNMKKPFIKEDKWFEYSNRWMVNLISLYDERSVTTYVHTFVYHLGFFLEKYGPLLAFANFSIESSHKVTKQNRLFATNNGISKKKKEGADNSFTTQLLSKFLRLSIIKRDHDREKWQEIDRDGTNWGNWDVSTRKNKQLEELFKINGTTNEDESKKNYLQASREHKQTFRDILDERFNNHLIQVLHHTQQHQSWHYQPEP